MTRNGLLALWTASNAVLISWMAVSLLLKAPYALIACLALSIFNIGFVAVHHRISRKAAQASQPGEDRTGMSPGQDWILAARQPGAMRDETTLVSVLTQVP